MYSVFIRILIEVEKNPKVIANVDFCGGHGVMNFLEVDGEQVENRDVWKQELTKWGQTNLIVHPGKTPQKLKLYIFPNTP